MSGARLFHAQKLRRVKAINRDIACSRYIVKRPLAIPSAVIMSLYRRHRGPRKQVAVRRLCAREMDVFRVRTYQNVTERTRGNVLRKYIVSLTRMEPIREVVRKVLSVNGLKGARRRSLLSGTAFKRRACFVKYSEGKKFLLLIL